MRNAQTFIIITLIVVETKTLELMTQTSQRDQQARNRIECIGKQFPRKIKSPFLIETSLFIKLFSLTHERDPPAPLPQKVLNVYWFLIFIII